MSSVPMGLRVTDMEHFSRTREHMPEGSGSLGRAPVLRETCAAQDGVLSDSELNDFQVHCFAVPLQPEELAGVKAVVSQKMPEVSNASAPLCVTALLPEHRRDSSRLWNPKAQDGQVQQPC